MINSGDKNVNVKEIIDKYSTIKKPTNDGIDDYVEKDAHVDYPRDKREHNVVDSIKGDQTKPTDSDDLTARVNKLEQIIDGK